MPTTSQHFSDLQLPTIFGDETTYGTILNTFIDGLAAKVADLNTRLATATTQLGDNSTSGSILHGIDQLNTLNAQVAANSPALVASNVLTGTETNIITSPDQFSGDRSTTSSFPAVPNASGTTANVLSALSPPTTEAEILAFDYLAFYNALAPIVSDLSARVSQIEADVLAARINVCKAKKYIDNYNAGGTVVRSWQNQYFNYTNSSGGSQLTNSFSANYNYTDISYVTRSDGRGTYTLTVKYTPKSGGNFNGHGVTNAQVHAYLQSTGMLSSGSQSVYILDYSNTSGYNVNDQLTTFPSGMSWASDTAHLSDYTVTWNSIGSTDSSGNGNELIVSGPSNTTQPAYDQSILFARPKVIETTVYGTPDVSTCDTSPGGPYYVSGSYS